MENNGMKLERALFSKLCQGKNGGNLYAETVKDCLYREGI